MKTSRLVTGYLLLVAGVLYFYFHYQQVQLVIDQWNEYLEGAIFVTHQYVPQISVLDFAGSVLCCFKYRTVVKGMKSWFEVLLAVTIMQFGGTTLTGFLLGQTPSWLMSRSAFNALLLAWWLTFYCPGDLYWKVLRSSIGPIILFVSNVFSTISGAHSIGTWGVDKAVFNAFHVNAANFHRAHYICILCGALSASGGGLLADTLSLLKADSFTVKSTPNIFKIGQYSVTATFNRSIILAILYYYLISDISVFLPNPFRITRIQAHSVVAIINLALFFLGNALPADVDPCQILTNSVLKLINVRPVIDLSESAQSTKKTN